MSKSQQLQVPSFMSPEMAMQDMSDRLDRYASKLRQRACANAVVNVAPPSIDEETKSVHPGDIELDPKHCQNMRRNGSKFCQACSDAYKNKQ